MFFFAFLIFCTMTFTFAVVS